MSETQKTVLYIIAGIAIIALIYTLARSFKPSETPMDDTTAKTETTACVPASPNQTYAFPGVLPDDKIADKKVTIATDKGEIVFELLDKEAPKTVSNFVYLTGKNYYNCLTFHRYEPGFVIQGGDPAGNGTGGPGYEFEDEKVTQSYKTGIVAMANRGPNTNGSQFFIMLADKPLPPSYTIFGKVTSGMDTVQKIRAGDVMKEVKVENQ